MAHPNKDIRAAIKYAEKRGWRFRKSSGHAHIYGQLFCPQADQSGCIVRVFSTPRNPGNHARRIIREVDGCPHSPAADEE